MKRGAPKGNKNGKKANPMTGQMNTKCHVSDQLLVKAAAEKLGISRSRFVIQSATAEARRVLGVGE